MNAKALPTSRTVQLEADNAQLRAEVAARRQLEGTRGAYLIGQLVDGLQFLRERSDSGDVGSQATLAQLKVLLEQLPDAGGSGARVLRPQPGQRFA